MVAYIERVARVCVALLYSEYRPWYVPRDRTDFALELGFAMEVPLGSRANV